jgi:hypothetical protein
MTFSAATGTTWSNTVCPDETNSDSDGGTCANNLMTTSVSDGIAQHSLRSSQAAADAYYAANGNSFSGIAPSILESDDPKLVFTNSDSPAPFIVSTVSSTNGNGMVLAAFSPPTGACWYIVDDQGQPNSSPWVGLPTASGQMGPVNIVFFAESIVYYAEVKTDAVAADCDAALPRAAANSCIYVFDRTGFPSLSALGF